MTITKKQTSAFFFCDVFATGMRKRDRNGPCGRVQHMLRGRDEFGTYQTKLIIHRVIGNKVSMSIMIKIPCSDVVFHSETPLL